MKERVGYTDPIIVRFAALEGDGDASMMVPGFNQLWVKYVRGFNAKVHCQNCLRGQRSTQVSRAGTPVNTDIVMNETERYDSVYVCGLASGKKSERWFKNLHLPLEHAPGESLSKTLYNGFTVEVTNARLLNYDLFPDRWLDLPREHVRCGNFRFGVRRFGYPGKELPEGA